MIHDIYLGQIKNPVESTSPWDLVRIVKTVSGRPGTTMVVVIAPFNTERGTLRRTAFSGRASCDPVSRDLC
jgi:hypothetical protein